MKSHTINSVQLYDYFAPHYAAYSRIKQKYLDAINRIVVLYINRDTKKLLDIGCGDGKRIQSIIGNKKIQAVLVDNSPEMVRLAKQNTHYVVIQDSISNIKFTLKKRIKKGSVQVITCLWNVLGHLPSTQERKTALRRMDFFLARNGKIILDVSNRYNMAHYGARVVIGNIIKDILFPYMSHGDETYTIHVNKKISIPSSCHFFSPFEIDALIKNTKLKIVQKKYINYQTGKLMPTFFQGHIVYILQKEPLP